MLRPRIIPCLLVHEGGLVKTVQFDQPKYVGDPINAVKIFNEKEVDELIVLDIDATVEGREPDYTMIQHLAAECRMPLCYGGGVSTVEQAVRIVKLGVEKIAFSAAAIETPDLITQVSAKIGAQSVVVVLDVKKHPKTQKYEVWIRRGKKNTGLCPFETAKKMQALGAGEIVVNAIDQDGMMKGYDLPLIEGICNAVTVPFTALGGAGTYADLKKLISKFGILGAAAGSLFVFKGVYRAVLINYPNRTERVGLIV
jgi:imidazole glycerol-phosphate synthase subunit HisF